MALSVGQFMVLAVALVALPLLAEVSTPIYQWTDEQGRTHFGDRPVKGAAVLPQPSPSRSTQVTNNSDRQAAQRRLLQVMALEREQKKQAKARRQEERAERQRRCVELAATLSELEDGHVVYYRDNEAGGRDYISDNERSRQAEKVRDLLEQNCN